MQQDDGREQSLARALELLSESMVILDAHGLLEAALSVSLAIEVLRKADPGN